MPVFKRRERVIFVSAPSKTNGKHWLEESRAKYLSLITELQLANQEDTFIFPMLLWEEMVSLKPSIPKTNKYWEAHYKRLIRACDEVWVLGVPGYDSSVGVKNETDYAESLGLPVVIYIAGHHRA